MRVYHDVDIIKFVTELAQKMKINIATFTAIGALKRAKLGFYDQENHKYNYITIEFPHELASCIGNISIKDGKPFVHAHAVLADKNGNTKAGHLIEGTVFASEVNLFELDGAKLERKHDKVTGLSLWSFA